MDSVELKKELNRARNAAFQFLKVRNRSEKEVKDRLKKKKFSLEITDETIEYLKKIELIDDRKFTRDWIQMRLKKPLGLRRIIGELREKGIKGDLIKEETQEIEKDSEIESIQKLIQKRAGRNLKLDPDKRQRRLFEYLIRRGFSIESVKKAIRHDDSQRD